MAQSTTLIAGRGHEFTASNVVTVPAAASTTLLILPVTGITRIFVQISVATQALDGFTILAKAHKDATDITLFSTAAHYTSPSDPMVNASGDMTTTAASGTGWFVMNTFGLYEVTIKASAAVDSAAVTIYASGQ